MTPDNELGIEHTTPGSTISRAERVLLLEKRIYDLVDLRKMIEANLLNHKAPAISAEALAILDNEMISLRDVWCASTAKSRVSLHLASLDDRATDADWKALVDARRPVDAIKILRARHGYSIRHAKDIMISYQIRKHGYHHG